MVGLHIEEAVEQYLCEFIDLVIICDNMLSGLDHALDVKEQHSHRPREDEEKEKEDNRKFLFYTCFKWHRCFMCSML